MRVTGVTANLPVADIGAARTFYADHLGLNVDEAYAKAQRRGYEIATTTSSGAERMSRSRRE